MVDASQKTGFKTRRSGGAYVVSTSCNRVPHGQNISGSILVAVMNGAALRARPYPHAQRKFLNDMPACRTCLRGREPAVDLDHGLAVHRRFRFKSPDYVSDTSIAQAARKASLARCGIMPYNARHEQKAPKRRRIVSLTERQHQCDYRINVQLQPRSRQPSQKEIGYTRAIPTKNVLPVWERTSRCGVSPRQIKSRWPVRILQGVSSRQKPQLSAQEQREVPNTFGVEIREQ